ncbi:hypothetical protein [Streptomyces sp. NPDC001537]
MGGFDDSVAATEATPALATTRQPYDRISSTPPVVLGIGRPVNRSGSKKPLPPPPP